MKIYTIQCVSKPFVCHIKYCRSRSKKSYCLVMDKSDFEALNFNKILKKVLVDWCYKYNQYRADMCPKHYKEFFTKHMNYIMWSVV